MEDAGGSARKDVQVGDEERRAIGWGAAGNVVQEEVEQLQSAVSEILSQNANTSLTPVLKRWR